MADSTSSGRLIFTTPDVYGNTVRCTERTWYHIEQRHPEMAGRVDDVKDAVAAPDGCRPSKLSETAIAWETFGTNPTDPGLRVLVNYADRSFRAGGSTGVVMTAYPPDPAYSSNVGPITLLTGGTNQA